MEEPRSKSFAFSEVLSPEHRELWDRGTRPLEALLSRVGASGHTSSRFMQAFPVDIPDGQRSVDKLMLETKGEGAWHYFGLEPNSHGVTRAFYVPVNTTNVTRAPKEPAALFVDVHSRIVAWWLMASWRSQQLAGATHMHATGYEIIPAACCARAFLETAAAIWYDSRRVAALWAETKVSVVAKGLSLQHVMPLVQLLYEMGWSGKFDKRLTGGGSHRR